MVNGRPLVRSPDRRPSSSAGSDVLQALPEDAETGGEAIEFG